MKKAIAAASVIIAIVFGACKKDKVSAGEVGYGNGPATTVPAETQGSWMYGNFSMTEYWGQNPADYIGNAFQFAIAFKFNSNGTYEQYFTSTVSGSGATTYQQSVTKGTVEVNDANGTIVTHANSARYKRTRGGQVIEERDLRQEELTKITSYQYETGTESNGTKAIYLLLAGTDNPLKFIQKF